jgi:hypothetical protein
VVVDSNESGVDVNKSSFCWLMVLPEQRSDIFFNLEKKKKKKKKKKKRVDLLVEKSLHCVSVAWKRCIMVVLK